MEKLLQGILEFRKNLTEDKRALFAELALEQKPDTLFVACSDSRVVPNLFASTNPGDLFVLRNIGNLIPPFESCLDVSAPAVLEFSVLQLKVEHIVICGHSECGAMQRLALRQGSMGSLGECPHLTAWLMYGEEVVERIRKGVVLDPSLSEYNQLSQINVLLQLEHVLSYPFIRERVEKRELHLHGWWFDIGRAQVHCFDPEFNSFVPIDESQAQRMMARL